MPGRTSHRARGRGRLAALAATSLVVALLTAAPRRADARTPERRYTYDMFLPTLRLGFGVAAHPTPAYPPGFAQTLHLGAGVHLVGAAGDPRIVLEPFVGYAFTGRDHPIHAFALGFGFAIGDSQGRIRGVLRPRLLAGARAGTPGIGLRTGLALEGLMGAVGVEVSHQFLRTGGATEHGVQVLLTTDLIALGLVIVRAWWQAE